MYPTDKELDLLAIPVAAALDGFEDKTEAMLAVFTLGLNIALLSGEVGARLSRIGQATMTNGGTLDANILKRVVATISALIAIEDARKAALGL